jgi:hypothetical protein
MAESDLYLPLKRAFEAQGFAVFGEVNACDLVARRGDELLIVEMKCAFNLELVFQGLERQRATETVYLAFEAPARYDKKRWMGMKRLCRRLGLGLIVVRMNRKQRGAKLDGIPDVLLDPAPYKPRIDARRRKLILHEIGRRSGDYNVGGSTRRKIVTAYREDALRIAQQLKTLGPSRVRTLALGVECKNAGSILLNNYYGWFQRLGRGTYQLTDQGERALETYREVISRLAAPVSA